MEPLSSGCREFLVDYVMEKNTGAFVWEHEAAFGQQGGPFGGQIGVDNRFKKRFHSRESLSAAPYEDYDLHGHIEEHYFGLGIGGNVGGGFVEVGHYALGVVDCDELREAR